MVLSKKEYGRLFVPSTSGLYDYHCTIIFYYILTTFIYVYIYIYILIYMYVCIYNSNKVEPFEIKTEPHYISSSLFYITS